MKLVSISCPLNDFIKKVAELNQKGGAIQIFHPGGIINRAHLSGAYINAVEAFRDSTNITKSVAMEMLLFAAMTTQIGVAISKLGAKNSKSILVFANSRLAYAKIGSSIAGAADFKPSRMQQLNLAKQYGIDGDDLDARILQKITLSRLIE